MIALFLLTFVYGSNAFSLNAIVQQGSLLHPIENSSTENHTSRTQAIFEKIETHPIENSPTENHTSRIQTIFEKIETDPKGFVSEVQKLDPAALKNVISLLEELLASSEARETHLIDSLQDANTALDNANTNVVNALDDLTAAQARTAAAKTEQSEAEAAEAAIQTDLAQKRQVHNEKLTEQGNAQTAHDDEVPSLNNEQQVLTDVIAMLQGLPAEGKDCQLDENKYMAAASLRDCLSALGSTGTKQIEYIETAYGHRDYLDKVCDFINPGSKYDKHRTESQSDECSGSSRYMYPSYCNKGWLGSDCNNGCGNANYLGFYCTD